MVTPKGRRSIVVPPTSEAVHYDGTVTLGAGWSWSIDGYGAVILHEIP